MKIRTAAVLGILVAIAPPMFAAEKPCSMLTGAELSAATGAKVGEGQDTTMVIPSGPAKGQTMLGCMWRVGEVGMVSISLIVAAKGPEREAGLARLREGTKKLEAQGWKRETKEFSDAKCSVLTPPASQEHSPIMTGCMAEAKGMGLSVGHMTGPMDKSIGMDNVHTLLETVVSRLP